MKKAIALVLALALCLALTGCQLVTNYFDGFVQLFGGGSGSGAEAVENLPELVDEPAPPPASSSEPLPEPEIDEPEEADDSGVGFELNEAFAELPRMTNGELKEIIDPNAPVDAQIIMGGIPYLSYYDDSVDIAMTFYLYPDKDDLLDVWAAADRADEYSMPVYNCFPDSYLVGNFILSGDPIFMDYIFEGEGEKTYEALCEYFGQDPGLTAEPNFSEGDGVPLYERVYCIFTKDGMNYYTAFIEEGGEYVPNSIMLYEKDYYGMVP